MNEDVKAAMASRGESHKALFFECFNQFEQAVRAGRSERVAQLRKVLLETFDSAADDITNLTTRLSEALEELEGRRTDQRVIQFLEPVADDFIGPFPDEESAKAWIAAHARTEAHLAHHMVSPTQAAINNYRSKFNG